MRFEYLEPASIEEAVSLLGRYGEKASVIAGGTDLLCQIRNGAARPEYVVDLEHVLLPGCIESGQGLRIGALTTIRALETSTALQPQYNIIAQAAGQLGSTAIRNVATIGGNLCSAVPSAETAPALIWLGARARIIGPDGEREVSLADFFVRPRCCLLKTGEILKEIYVTAPPPHTVGVYIKHSVRGTIDLAIVGVAVVVTMDAEICQEVSIALGAVAPTPMRAIAAERLLRGRPITPALLEKAAAAAAAESQPISDVRASADYRRQMVRVIARQALKKATASGPAAA